MILQPGDIAVDYVSKKDPAVLVAAGVRLVVRYISPTRSHAKNLTVAERDALHAAGLSIMVVWENKATDPLSGGALGKVHGIQAGNFARDLGFRPDDILIVAVDFDVQAAQMATVIAYLSAFASLCPFPLWVYGKDTVVDAAVNAGVCVGGWQTVAWSHGRRSPNAFVLQHATPVHPAVAAIGAIDDNTVLKTFKAWSTVPDVTPAPSPPLPEDDDMAKLASNEEARQMPWGLSAPGTEIFLVGTRKRSVSAEEYNDLYANAPAPRLTNAVLDSIPDETVETAVPAVDYDKLAAAIAPLLPHRFDGSITVTAAG